jgi:hypothetical protein
MNWSLKCNGSAVNEMSERMKLPNRIVWFFFFIDGAVATEPKESNDCGSGRSETTGVGVRRYRRGGLFSKHEKKGQYPRTPKFNPRSGELKKREAGEGGKGRYFRS